MVNDDFGIQNEHYHQRWSHEVAGIPNVRASIEWAYHKLERGKRCMEVGVADGANAKVILDLLQPSFMLLVDIHDSVPRRDRLAEYLQCHHVIGKSQEVLKKMSPNQLDFAYIDADHDTPAVISDIRDCIRLVRVGGIVGGDDYDEREHPPKEVAAALLSVFGNLDIVRSGGYDWWVTVTPDMKKLV